MSEEDESPSFDSWFNEAIEHQLVQIHTSIPASIIDYDAAKQRATVQPLIRQGHRDESDERVAVKMAPILDVPVEFPGSGPFSITWPLAKGHTGMLTICESSIALWKTRGGDVDPGDDRRFNLSDAVFRPGLRDFAHSVRGTHGTAMVIDGPLIHAGGNKALALNDDLEALRLKLGALTGPLAPVATAASGGLGRTFPFTGTSKLKGG